MCFCIKKVLGEISKYSQIYINFDRFHLFYVQNYSSNSLLMLKYDGLHSWTEKSVGENGFFVYDGTNRRHESENKCQWPECRECDMGYQLYFYQWSNKKTAVYLSSIGAELADGWRSNAGRLHLVFCEIGTGTW